MNQTQKKAAGFKALFEKALEAAGLQINRLKRPGAGRLKTSYSRSRKATLHSPDFTLRICNMCEREFYAEDNMRSCPACTAIKKGSENSCSFSDTNHGIGYLH